MALLRPLLAAAASVAIAAAAATGQRAPGLACKHGALAAGGDIKRENMTVASASAWCESQPACAGFTANTNGTAGICGGGGGSEQLFDMRFKDSEQGNGDPLWTTWTRPGHTSVYFFCSAEHTCSLCDPPNASCAKVTYLGPDCFGECNGTAPQRSVSAGAGAGPPPAPTDGSSSCVAAACVGGAGCEGTITCEPLLAGASALVDVSLQPSDTQLSGGNAHDASMPQYLDGQIFAYASSATAPRNATVASIVSGMSNHHEMTPADAVAMAVAASKRGTRAGQALDFILYPEVFLFNGSNAEWNDLDDPASYGLSMRTCIDAATATGSYVVCTFYELATRNASGSRGPSYNTAVLINRSGRPVGKYRKACIRLTS